MDAENRASFSPGTLVNCRQRLWRVDYQEKEILHLTAVDQSDYHTKAYLPVEKVTPSSLEYPSPQKIGSIQDQKLMLEAFRLSMVNSTTPYRALQYSRAIPISYQLVPVTMALEQEKVRMLIADDVGLGKTVEAGLIIQELRVRGLAKKVLVICPANLRQQWKEALEYFFHIEADIYSRETRRQLEKNLPAGTNLLEFRDAFVISVDYAKATEVKNLLLDTNWDVVVIDEAHQVAKPHQASADQSVLMDRWNLARDLSASKRIEHLLLLTATPHNGYTDSFASLINLLGVGAVSGPVHNPIIHREIAKDHLVQRRRADVEAWLSMGNSKIQFPKREQSEEVIKPTSDELAVIEAVKHYSNLILDNAKGASKHIYTLAGWTVLHLHKRALSSPQALRCSLQNRKRTLERRVKDLTEDDPGLSVQDARANVLDDQVSDLYDEDEIILRSDKITPGSPEMIRAELQALEKLITQADQITPSKDSKLFCLTKNTLPSLLRNKPKVIIFTKYRDTMHYLEQQLRANPRFADAEILTLDGTLNEKERGEVFTQFGEAHKAILVATDAISEGINLQQYASQIIHYELPWNPNRLEQRNGRVDRFGQTEPVVQIRTMVMDETLDATILKVLVQKANQIRQDYGFSPPYFGDETSILSLIQEHGYRILQPDLFSMLGSPSNHNEDPFNTEVLERIKQDSFYGQTDLSLPFIQEQIDKTYQTVGSPEMIKNFVISGLKRFNCAMTENKDGTYRIAIQHRDLKLPGKEDIYPSASFDPNLGLQNSKIEILDLGHPLVRRLIDLIKQETFNLERGSYGRSAGLLTQDVSETTAVVTLLLRFVTETTPAQIFEDLVTFAFNVYSGEVLPPEVAQRLAHPTPATGALDNQEISEVLADALAHPDLPKMIADCIEARRQEIIYERQAFRQGINRELHWLKESDQIKLGSSDILAITILWPAK